ncbi:GGDEF domain-containing protein [Deinococcus aquiradiocola]|uniref:GGDEF domain-containing protein n=1 Tax=Deinococcus aquiradiocola TaxID=393059 RepID=A0A917UKF5_9DEIO|nr:GGDEF domain-containing protein [Deinococcus aquiradiocola]GGJ62999.1 hypothetical protein GCM10008939_03610 [Deinococcus aquiradiocola]
MSRPPWTLQPPQEQVGPDLPLARRRTSLITLAIGVPTLILLWLYALLYQRDNLLLLYVPLLLAVLLLGYLTQWLAGSSRASSERGPAWLILGATAAALVYRLAFPAQFDAWLQMFVALLVVLAGMAACLRFRPRQALTALTGLLALYAVSPLVLTLTGQLGPVERMQQLITVLMVAAVLSLVFSAAWTREALGQSEAMSQQMEYLSNIDHLTGLDNRRSLYGRIEQLMDDLLDDRADTASARIPVTTFSLVLLDVDHFKSVNDTFGHASGDTVLCGVADVLKSFVRDRDLAGRWGGEEFVLVLPGASLERAARIAERLRARIEEERFLPHRTVTASFGVAEYRRGDRLEALVARADQAMYRAKQSGRNRVVLHTSANDTLSGDETRPVTH